MNKKFYSMYSSKKYRPISSLFLQRSIIMLFLKDIIQEDMVLNVGFEVDAWRYVFEKDITKSQFMKNMLKNKISNLVALEVLNKLNYVREIINELYKEEKIKK